MSKHRSVFLSCLLLFVVGPLLIQAVEWRLRISPFYGLTVSGTDNGYTSTTWEAYNEARGYVFATMLESNDTRYAQPSLLGGEISLTGWFTQEWGVSLSLGLSPFYQSVQNEYHLDYLWYDGELSKRYSNDDQRSRLTRIWADVALNHRFFLGNRSALLVNAGFGVHHLTGQVRHEFGWAAAAIADKYYIDYFLLPLSADFNHTFLAGQVALTYEYRLSRVISFQIGVSGWLAEKIQEPYLLDENQVYFGEEKYFQLTDLEGLLSSEERKSYTMNPNALRFMLGFSFWL